MTDYINFVTFRLERNAGYQHRYDDLMAAVHNIADGKYWDPATSFIAFPTTFSVAQTADYLKDEIDPKTDLLVVGSMTHKNLVVIGNNPDQDIYAFCDFARRG